MKYLFTLKLGHKSVETTMIYTHVVSELNKSKVISSLDFQKSGGLYM